MESTTVSKSSIAFGLSLAIACIVNAALVVAKEKSAAVMHGMDKTAGHHWIAHTVIVLAVFFLLALTFKQMNGGQGMEVTTGRLIGTLVGGVVLSGCVIVGFYLIVG